MKIYLVRHGDYVPLDMDPEGPLSKQGQEDITALASTLIARDTQPTYIFHSQKLRAKQTAGLIAAGISFPGTLEERPDMNPESSIDNIVNALSSIDNNLMLVGHMPFMTKLLSKLVTNNEGHNLVAFHTGTVICLNQTSQGNWLIDWVIYPL